MYRFGLVWFMVFNAIFNNISLISWQSVPGETTDLSQVTDKLYHIMLYQVHHYMNRVQTHNFKSNYHTITTMMAPYNMYMLLYYFIRAKIPIYL
jgi:hypothetical protein